MAIIATSCLWENGLKYGQVASLLQKNQEFSKLVKTEIEKSLIEKVMVKKRNQTKNLVFWGNFPLLFILPLNLAAVSTIAMKNPNFFFADFLCSIHSYILIAFIFNWKMIFLEHPIGQALKGSFDHTKKVLFSYWKSLFDHCVLLTSTG